MPVKEPFRMVEWDESMAVGIAPIDKQHRYLVDTLWLANDKLSRADDDILMGKIIKEMLAYAIMHFETEEGLMQRYDYAEISPKEARDHVAQHREFSYRMTAFYDQLHEGRHISRMEVLTFLNDWLQNHLLGVDQMLGNFLQQTMKDQGRGSDD